MDIVTLKIVAIGIVAFFILDIFFAIKSIKKDMEETRRRIEEICNELQKEIKQAVCALLSEDHGVDGDEE